MNHTLGTGITKFLIVTLYELLLLAIAALATISLLDIVSRTCDRLIVKLCGTTGYLAATAISTVIHEVSHAVLCVLFNHRIERMALFSFDPATGRCGYVIHQWDTKSLYQKAGNFFIGIAPVIAGIPLLFIWGAACGIHSDIRWGSRVVLSHALHRAAPDVIRYVFAPLVNGFVSVFTGDNIRNPYFYLYLPAAFLVSRGMAPSLQDMKGCMTGVTAVIFFVFIINGIMAFVGRDPWRLAEMIIGSLSAALHLVGTALAVNIFFMVIILLLQVFLKRGHVTR